MTLRLTGGRRARSQRGATRLPEQLGGRGNGAVQLVDEPGWENVHVVRADAADTCGPDETFDAVGTTFALQTFPDAATALANVRDALSPDGRFVVLDSRPITDGPARLLNPLYVRAIERAVNHRRV